MGWGFFNGEVSMRKKIMFFGLMLVVLSVSAGEKYSANFSAPSNTGASSINFKIELDLDIKGDGVFDGQVLKVWGATTCRYPVPLTGKLVGEDISFKSEINEVKGCGRIVFNGKRVGEKLVGVLPSFQGRAIEVTFSR